MNRKRAKLQLKVLWFSAFLIFSNKSLKIAEKWQLWFFPNPFISFLPGNFKTATE
jgi:hypothetical protein